ncbi:hypothetical protein A2866_02445 [Candidatus Roizmanbacteria bacterium RIFCSPHIGHO2_01_FULL_39_8]|uniref:Hemolysin n=1 Tax=Candidatus Roizmanbacteria bacterium RIFCSPHIGHO2_01_FULL_39_8 TaxID=1802033 RepID=A0A1F7GTA2_9BACT|nr:MAG: hypothetical protein A2866_02445 [Candidatus Roizmanbacteria bacterium RIFCSPHIGHO2_01_FULL_39_8]
MTFLFQIILVVLLVFLNGFFVAAEFALVAIRKTRIEELAKKGITPARMVLKALNELESYISATQLGITLASLALGWIGEPALARFLEPFLSFLPNEASIITAHTLAVIIAFSLITFLHIVFGELAPKTIALQKSEATSLFIIAPLMFFTNLFKPFIWVLNGAGSLVLKPFGFSAPSAHQLVHSEEEIKMILAQSAEGGAIEKREGEMIHKILSLGDIPVKNIMMPRTEIEAVSADIDMRELKTLVRKSNLSRYPVYKVTIDTVLGYVHEKDVNKFKTHNQDISLLKSGIIRAIINVPEGQRIDDVLYAMRKKRVHMAVVNDEYGGTAGIVTLEDVLESIVGEIYDEFDTTDVEIKKQPNGTYLVNGLVSTQSIRRKFNLPIKGQGYVTIGGVVFGLLGREPRGGDSVQIGNLELKVNEVEKKRIKTLILTELKRKSSR